MKAINATTTNGTHTYKRLCESTIARNCEQPMNWAHEVLYTATLLIVFTCTHMRSLTHILVRHNSYLSHSRAISSIVDTVWKSAQRVYMYGGFSISFVSIHALIRTHTTMRWRSQVYVNNVKSCPVPTYIAELVCFFVYWQAMSYTYTLCRV